MTVSRSMWLPATDQYEKGKMFEYDGITYRVIERGNYLSEDRRRVYCRVLPVH